MYSIKCRIQSVSTEILGSELFFFADSCISWHASEVVKEVGFGLCRSSSWTIHASVCYRGSGTYSSYSLLLPMVNTQPNHTMPASLTSISPATITGIHAIRFSLREVLVLVFPGIMCSPQITLSVKLFSTEPISHPGRSWLTFFQVGKDWEEYVGVQRTNCLRAVSRKAHACLFQTLNLVIKSLSWCMWGIRCPSMYKLQI